MGTWGLGTFEDDVACDWLEDLFDSDPILFFRQCLDLRGQSDLGHVACVGVVCTAEIFLGLLGCSRAELPADAQQWINDNAGVRIDSMIPDALAGLAHVLGDRSAMRALWEDSDGQYDQWRGQVQDLANRLSATQTDDR